MRTSFTVLACGVVFTNCVCGGGRLRPVEAVDAGLGNAIDSGLDAGFDAGVEISVYGYGAYISYWY